MTPPSPPRRGKCSVTLLNETDILGQYLEKEVRPQRPPSKKLGVGGDLGDLPHPADTPPTPFFLCPSPGLFFLLSGV